MISDGLVSTIGALTYILKARESADSGLNSEGCQVLKLIVFAFSDNLSAENSELSADSGIPGIPLLECMQQRDLAKYDKVDTGKSTWNGGRREKLKLIWIFQHFYQFCLVWNIFWRLSVPRIPWLFWRRSRWWGHLLAAFTMSPLGGCPSSSPSTSSSPTHRPPITPISAQPATLRCQRNLLTTHLQIEQPAPAVVEIFPFCWRKLAFTWLHLFPTGSNYL